MTIVNPAALITEFVRHLRGISALVALVGNNASNIEFYSDDDGGDLMSTIRSLHPPKLLVYLEGIVPRTFPARVRVQIGIAVRAPFPPLIYSTLAAGMSSATGADGLPLIASTIHPSFDPMEIPTLVRRIIPVTELSAYDYWEIQTAFIDKSSE